MRVLTISQTAPHACMPIAHDWRLICRATPARPALPRRLQVLVTVTVASGACNTSFKIEVFTVTRAGTSLTSTDFTTPPVPTRRLLELGCGTA